jgi:Family of unknown function (DUF5947)
VTAGPGLRRFVPPPRPEPAAPASPAPAAPLAPSALPTLQVQAAAPRPGAEEACEFCAEGLAAEHAHVADLDTSSLMCACRACYLLFTHSGAAERRQAGDERRQHGRGRYRSIPDRYRSDPGRPLTVADWDTLEIPVGLAFFLRSSADGGVTGFYPSPAGATECRLDLQAWDRIATAHPLLAAAEPDVEAILISREAPGAGVECFLVPIDACYELAGRMRLHWRGFDGGAEARDAIAAFLESVRARSRDFSREP